MSKHLWKGEEGNGRGTTGDGGQGVWVHSEDGRKDGKTSDDGNAVVGQPHREGVEDGVLVFAHVHGVGDAHSHTGRTGPSGLREAVDPYLWFKQHVKINGEHEECSVKGAVAEVHPQRKEEGQEEQDKEGNHEVEVHLLNGLGSFPNGAEHQKNHHELEENDLSRRLQKCIPHLGGVDLIAVQCASDAQLEVFQRPSRNHGVVEPNSG